MQQEQALPSALVVEDDIHIGQLLQFMLGRSGYRVTLIADGQAAQDHILSQPAPTVMLLDVMLPHVDGLQLVALLRQQPAWERVPVLMLTAKAQERDIARALEAGATDYLVKPFLPEDLLARLRALTGG
ncbi:response regulator transcription factor [Ramlibacter sp. G-1-2-2]|uniref:Response regulator transcription factor n=1 Tax=Ramlibacter agri TaxID=2728837 RepID=A0A848H6L4_9BURK|nr:response regulator transcription factor [Ramlibacter agri]NML45502.1 response regulator transcription factor [Ramlibacter agri]